ncbi:hypothetical protein N9W21_09225 [Shewanella sp.]|nr:hypothetical protein [Shewanella sp.]
MYELTAGKLQSAATDKVLARITEYAKDKGYDKKITDVLSDMHQSETNGTPFPHSDKVNVSRNPNLDNLPPGYEVLPDGRIRGSGGGIAKDSNYKTPDGDVIFQRETGSYYYIKADGTLQSVGSPRDTGDYLKYDNVWAPGVRPVDRGRQIQAELAKTEYQQWGNTDFYEIVDPVTGQSKKVVAQNFPLIDFELDGMVVSLKTINTIGTRWLTDMDYHMRDLANRGIWSDGVLVPSSNRILDIRVQPGGLADTSKLESMAVKHGITIKISEYGN